MAPPGNGARRFEVHCSGAIAEIIRQAHRQAWLQGRGRTVTKSFRQVIRRLETDTFHLGETAYRLPSLRMEVRTVVVRPLVVDFAICEDHPLVFIKGVKLLSTQDP